MNEPEIATDLIGNSHEAEQRDVQEHVLFPHYLPVVQFSLRLLGVYVAAVGISYALQSAVELLLFDPMYVPQVKAALVGNIAYAAFGIYLAIGGRWIIEKVFLPRANDNSLPDHDN